MLVYGIKFETPGSPLTGAVWPRGSLVDEAANETERR
jgi:hypothetical protein